MAWLGGDERWADDLRQLKSSNVLLLEMYFLAPLRSRAGARLAGIRFTASTGNQDWRKFHRKRAATDIAQDQPCSFHRGRHQTSTGMTEPDQQQTLVVTVRPMHSANRRIPG